MTRELSYGILWMGSCSPLGLKEGLTEPSISGLTCGVANIELLLSPLVNYYLMLFRYCPLGHKLNLVKLKQASFVEPLTEITN